MLRIEILKFAAFYNEGVRGLTGGAAKNDKVYGVARINGSTVNFWGRRGGELRLKSDAPWNCIAQFEKKIGGRKSGDVYTEINNLKMRDTLFPNLYMAIARAV